MEHTPDHLREEPDIDSSLLMQLQEARAAGASIHDMPPALTAILAEHDIYTTTEPCDPGTFRDFRKAMAHERALGAIAAHMNEVMQQVPEYEGAVSDGTLGSSLAETFSAVTRVKAKDVYVANPQLRNDKIVDGTVTAESMAFTVPTLDHARKLHIAFQGLLRTRRGFYPIYMHLDDAMLPTVEVLHLNEHTIRSVGRAVGALVAIEDSAAGIILPPEKRSLVYWQEQGETFPPELQARLTAADLAYRSLEKVATYRDHPDAQPITREHLHLLGTDAAPVFQAMRDIVNGLIWKIRGGSQRNLEQNPDQQARLLIEEDVKLTRDPVEPAKVYYGPPTSRAFSTTEWLRESGQRTMRHAREAPIIATLRLFSKAMGAGIELGVSALEHLPAVGQTGKELAGDAHAWKRQKAAVAATNTRLDRLIDTRPPQP